MTTQIIAISLGNAEDELSREQLYAYFEEFGFKVKDENLGLLENEKVLIDGVSSWWTACHGYNHPDILDAMKKQLNEMPHIMFGGFTHNPAEKLAANLKSLLPSIYNHYFFVDSGSVAVEVSMKMAIQYWVNKKNKKTIQEPIDIDYQLSQEF